MALELRREDFIAQYPPLSSLNKAEIKGIWEKEEIHLYVHIPYCAKKCGFCYYKSFTAGSNGVPDEYIEALKKEIDIYSSMPEVQSKSIRSLYLGGGTPTLLTEKQLESLITYIKSKFNFKEDYEFCSEARPGLETSLSKLELLKDLGMKRLSLGCQSVDDSVLVANGRNHTSAEFYKVMELARKAGIYSINVDIMTGMVDQSMNSWLETVKKICELKPENVAVYKLEVYLNNALYMKFRKGNIKLISDSQEAEYARAGYKELLSNGYIFSDNFSFMTDSKYDHVHRRDVWNGADMLGIGLSAHSCFGDHVYQNVNKLEDYMKLVEERQLPIHRAHKISKKEEMIQRAIFGLKNLHFNRKPYEEEFGVDIVDVFPKQIKSLTEAGFLTVHPEHIEMSFEGAIFADDLAREFYLPEHKKLMLAHVRRSEY